MIEWGYMKRKLYHLDLFSGIGGFAIAAESVWPNIEHTFVEYDPFCQAVLRKHWPQAKIHGDIYEFITDTRRERRQQVSKCPYGNEKKNERRTAKHNNKFASWYKGDGNRVCDILTGGFPCQPFSQAGRRKGTADDRYLWPAMYEAIQLFRPEWVIAENVAGLVTWNNGMVLETVCSDLEKEGYEVQPFIIPACAVGAPHRRDRVWIVGHAKHNGQHGTKNGEGGTEGINGYATRKNKDGEFARPALARSNASDTKYESEGNEVAKGVREETLTRFTGHSEQWNENWTEVAARLCTLDDGLPDGLVRPRGWRNAALKAAGNAIVPQVAEQIMRATITNLKVV